MANLYLADALRFEDCGIGAEIAFSGSEARHAATVSRMRAGEPIALGNGRGLIVHGTVTAASADQVSLRVDGIEQTERPGLRLVLVQALAKGGRDELAIQAATELGVDAVIPWAAERSVSRWDGQKAAKGRQRWTSIVREATKQSIRPWIPEVADLETTKQLAARAAAERMLVLDPGAAEQLSAFEPDRSREDALREPGAHAGRDILLVIGPEGGLAEGELAQLIEAGAQAVRLGATVLRTSTAGPAAIAVLNGLLGRW